MSRPLDVLVATSPYSGHITPLVPIARALADRGHHVRWCTGREFADQVKDTGATFEPMHAAGDPDGRAVDEVYPERMALKGIAQLRHDIRSVFLDPIPAQLADLRALVAERPTDVVVHDAAYGGAGALDALGGPLAVSVGTTPLSLPSPHVAPFGLGLQPGSGSVARLRNRALQVLLDRVIFRDVHARLYEIQAELGLPVVKHATMAGISPHLHLQNGVAGLEHPRPDLPAQVRFVGALVDRERTDGAPEWFAELEHADRPIIHVTQGTVADGDLEELVVPTLRALADLDVLVVAGTGTRDTRVIGDVPANARLAPFIPHGLLMPKLSAMVTNGGYGAVQQALAHGVPLVVAGSGKDKPEVAARVARAGVGIDLRTSKPKPEAIRTAVRTLLGSTTHGSRAQAMAADYRSRDAGAASADLIEELVKNRGESLPRTPN